MAAFVETRKENAQELNLPQGYRLMKEEREGGGSTFALTRKVSFSQRRMLPVETVAATIVHFINDP